MICKKCEKEYSDDFAFCPYCGAKNTPQKKAGFTNIDWFSCAAGEKELTEKWSEIKKMPAKDAIAFLNEKHDAIDCWSVGAHWVENRGSREENRNCYTVCAGREYYEWLTKSQWFRRFNSFEAYRKTIAKADLPFIGNCVFYTREECEAVVEKMREEFLVNV